MVFSMRQCFLRMKRDVLGLSGFFCVWNLPAIRIKYIRKKIILGINLSTSCCLDSSYGVCFDIRSRMY